MIFLSELSLVVIELPRPNVTPNSAMANILFAANDQRSRMLSNAIRQIGHNVTDIDHNHVDFLSKYAAALLSFSSPPMEWWGNYQMHPLVQRARARTLSARAAALGQRFDGVVLWGSWFAPTVVNADGSRVPYVFYMDQSRAIIPDPREQALRFTRNRSGHRAQRVAYEGARCVFAMSQWAVSQSIEAHPGLPPDRIQWAGWGPCAFDVSTEPIAQRPERPMILHVGNDFYRKGVDWLVETARRVKQHHPQARFVLVGRDQSGTHVDFGDAVENLGPISDPTRLLGLFREATLFFLPNRYDRSPHVLIEAMSTGLPLVVSQQGGPEELVADGRVGLGVPVGDVDGYVAAIRSLIENPGRREAMGVAAQEQVRKLYNWKRVATRIMHAFAPD